MTYHEIIIQLHRPFLAGDSPVETDSHSIDTCFNSAQDICRILLIFNHDFTFQYLHPRSIPIILLAGMVHLLCTTLLKDARAQVAQQHLRLCFHALADLGQSFSGALQALGIIRTFKKDLAGSVRAPGSLAVS